MSSSLHPPLLASNGHSNSSKNNNNSSFQLPGLPQSLSESLVKGTSIPPPLPSPPPSEPSIISITPERPKPGTAQPATLPSPPLTRSMPGAFPTSRSPSPNNAPPQTPRNYSRGSNPYSPSPQASETLPRSPNTPKTKSPRRPGGLRNLLSFRRSSLFSPISDASRGEPSRPTTPGGLSIASTFGMSLGRNSGGGFWRRKSGITPLGDEQRLGGLASPGPNGYGPDGAGLEAHRATAHPLRESISMNRRPSGSFWRRKSSMTLNMDGQDGYFPPAANGNGALGGEETPLTSLNDVALNTRPKSPPPKLPELSGGNVHLDADDMFKDIR